MFYKKEIGNFGENEAVKFLKKKHYRIVKRNFSCKFGEIDIIARFKKELVFVEVKTRSSKAYGGGIMAVNTHKRRNIYITSEIFMNKIKYEGARRYDIIEVYVDETKSITEINHIENAFPWEGKKGLYY